MTDLPEVKLKSLVNFPITAVGRTGIDATKEAGTFYLDLNYADFQITPTVSAEEMPNSYNLIWNEETATFAKVPFALQATSGVASLGAQTGAIDLGSTLQMTGSTLEVNPSEVVTGDVVRSFAAQTGDILLDSSLELTGSTLGVAGDTTIDDIVNREFPSQLSIIRPVGFDTINPLASTWKRVSTPGVVKPWHKVDASGQYWEISDHVIHPFMFGAKGDDTGTSGTDDSAAFLTCFEMMNGFAAVADITGIPCAGVMIVPPGRYYTAAKIDGFTPWAYRNTLISGFGATIRPGDIGSASGVFEFGVAGNGFGVTVEGLTFDLSHADNRAVCAIRLKGSSSTTLRKVTVAGGGWLGNQGFQIKQADENDYQTGSYWVTIDDCFIRMNGAVDMPYGIYSSGSNNFLIVKNTKITVGPTGVGILIADNLGTHTGGSNAPYSANSVEILNNAFEGCAYGVWYDIPNAFHPFGLIGNGNRFETTDVAWHVSKVGTLIANSEPPKLLNNSYTGVTTIVSNPAGAVVNFYDQRNRTGTATIANGTSTIAVSFPVAEHSANYDVSVSGADGSLYVTNKVTTGFDIVRTGTSGALPVRWTLHPGIF